tara:strand:+ start:178 stop:423 length:246 start_codon:yes stop_codon:yes gene_type:complete
MNLTPENETLWTRQDNVLATLESATYQTFVLRTIARTTSLEKAAKHILTHLKDISHWSTPEGVEYTDYLIFNALVEMVGVR